MDSESFDTLARWLAIAGTRRAALGVLLGGGLLGLTEVATARKHRRHANRKPRRKAGRVAAQAACGSPGPGANLNGCDFSGLDLTGVDWHGSSLRNANFTDANLAGADLHGSGALGADFTRANLCGAKLYSSTLRQVKFTDANLSRADLHSSSCGGASFAGATFCETIRCNGTVAGGGCSVCCRAAECDSGLLCCDGECRGCCDAGDCAGNEQCCDGECRSCCDAGDCAGDEQCCDGECRGCCDAGDCASGFCFSNGICSTSGCAQDTCDVAGGVRCGTDIGGDICLCYARANGDDLICIRNTFAGIPCEDDADCGADRVCVALGAPQCFTTTLCAVPCTPAT